MTKSFICTRKICDHPFMMIGSLLFMSLCCEVFLGQKSPFAWITIDYQHWLSFEDYTWMVFETLVLACVCGTSSLGLVKRKDFL